MRDFSRSGFLNRAVTLIQSSSGGYHHQSYHNQRHNNRENNPYISAWNDDVQKRNKADRSSPNLKQCYVNGMRHTVACSVAIIGCSVPDDQQDNDVNQYHNRKAEGTA
ncbi:MAG: hypothetical protein EOO77_15510 [Oxalobacteraceae bacterium]|nr:MAG: hypothetical protein EOO77_15510 [Oxalobacteraceae bacterium]